MSFASTNDRVPWYIWLCFALIPMLITLLVWDSYRSKPKTIILNLDTWECASAVIENGQPQCVQYNRKEITTDGNGK